MVENAKLSKKMCPDAATASVMQAEQSWFRSVLATTIWLVSWTRPDIAYAVSKLCRFMHNPGKEHIIALKRLLRYLQATCEHGLVYDFSAESTKKGVYGMYDASHADCPDTLRSTLAYLFFMEGCPVSWHTKLHSYITTSTNHSEFCAAAKTAREAKWFEKLLVEIGFGAFCRPIDLFSDSKGAIAMTYNPTHRAASKHVDLADHYAREMQERGTINVIWLSTKEMIADVLTKALGIPAFSKFASMLVSKITM